MLQQVLNQGFQWLLNRKDVQTMICSHYVLMNKFSSSRTLVTNK